MPPDRPRAEAIDVALDAASPILDILETALDLAPVPGLGLIPKALSALVDRVKVARANEESRNSFIAQVQALGAVIKQTLLEADASVAGYGGDVNKRRKVVDGIAHSKELQSGVQELLSVIEELKENISKLKGGPGFRGSAKGVLYGSRNEAVLADMKGKLATAIELFKLRGQIAIQKGVHEIQRLLKEAEEERIVNSIPRVPASYDAQTVDQLKGDFTQGTREGLFEELQSWYDGCFPKDEPKQFYFLSGGAGLGKSAISHQLCTRLDNPEHGHQVGASYFFVRDNEGLSSLDLFLSTLLHQLALSQPTLRPHIIAAVQEYLQRGDQQKIGYASKNLFWKALLKASTSEPDHPSVFLVIDGLDECKERDLLPQLLRSLLELAREVSCLRVFAASRPEPRIMAVLTAPEARDIVHSRSLDDTLEELKGDVKLYLEETVPRIPSYAAYLRDNPDALERLSRRAAGVFIYASTAVKFLEAYRDHPEEQFELLFSSEGAPWLSPIDALYLQVLRSAFPPKDLRQARPARRERLLSLLQVLVLDLDSDILRPSCIVLLGSGLSEDDVTSMVDSLRSVLFINKNGEVRPLHATFREFLVDKDRCVDSLYHVDAGKGHARLASACLAAISVRNVTELLANPFSAVGRYVYYAALRWGGHLEYAESDTELENRLRTFLQGSPQVICQMVLHHLGALVVHIHTLSTYQMAQFLKASGQAKELCSEYAKFSAYSDCWYREVGQNPDTPLDQLAPDMDNVAEELREIGGVSLLRNVELDLTLQHTDMEQYQAAHAALAREICKDERARALWFPERFSSSDSEKDGSEEEQEEDGESGERGQGEEEEDGRRRR